PPFGRLMGTSATLMERPAPYQLLVELTRGKVNQVRSQAADWAAGGLEVSPSLDGQIRDMSLAFARAACAGTPEEVGRNIQPVLELAYQAAEGLVGAYVEQVFQLRHQRQPRLDSALACRPGPGALPPEQGAALAGACNQVVLPLSWHTVES